MSQRVSTAGMSLQYAVETTAGVRPTSGYQIIPEIKSMPSFNPSPNTIDSTTLLETEYMTYVKGLKDLGGALEYGANLTDDLIDFWESLLSTYDSAAAEGKSIWCAIVHPKLSKATYFTGDPSPIGLNEASVGGMAETTLYITPTGAPVMAVKPGSDDTSLSQLAISGVSFNKYFNPSDRTYTGTTSSTTSTVTAVASDSSASVAIDSNDATVSGNSVTWASGSNTITITVTKGGASTVYTIYVTKS